MIWSVGQGWAVIICRFGRPGLGLAYDTMSELSFRCLGANETIGRESRVDATSYHLKVHNSDLSYHDPFWFLFVKPGSGLHLLSEMSVDVIKA